VTHREFESLYEEEYQAVYRATYLLCRDPTLAADATQEAFVRALERWPRLRDKTWAGGWVVSTALNFVRRSLRRRRVVDVAVSDQPSDADATFDLWQRVRHLPLRQQQAIVLHYRLGLSQEETAMAMGLAPSTVRVHRQQGPIDTPSRVGRRP
jgi:RNA polymerase sigma-70 factor, ECF subfamily